MNILQNILDNEAKAEIMYHLIKKFPGHVITVLDQVENGIHSYMCLDVNLNSRIVFIGSIQSIRTSVERI